MSIRQLVTSAVVIALGGSASVAPVHAAGPRYSITDLGALTSTWTSRATGINDLGEVVGRSDSYAVVPEQGGTFIWSQGTGIQAIGPRGDDHLVGPELDTRFKIRINNAGMVAGLPIQSAILLPGQGSLSVPLPPGIGTPLWVETTDINNRGAVVGVDQGSDIRRSYLWSRETGPIDLGPSTAMAINDSGPVVGRTQSGAGAWTPQTGWMDLGIADGYGAAVNWAGQIVVNRVIPQPSPGCVITPGACRPPTDRSLIWTQGHAIDLGILPGDDSTRGEAINAYGVAVGTGYYTLGLAEQAVIFDHGQLTDLNTLIAPGTGWILEDAAAINNLGWIVGTGGINSNRVEQHAFLLRPVG